MTGSCDLGNVALTFKMLRDQSLIHTVEDHKLLHFLDLFELIWKVLIRCMELEVRFEVHLGPLLQKMGSDKALHMQPLLLLLFFTFTHQCLLGVLLEVFEYELLLLIERAIVHSHSCLIMPTIRLLLDILAHKSRVSLLAAELSSQVSLFKNVSV